MVPADSRIFTGNTNPANDVTHYNHYTIGTSNNIEEHTPAWEVTMIRNEIASSSTHLTGAYGFHNIPQLDVEIEYTISIGSPDQNNTATGLAPSADLQVGLPFDDGTFLKVQPEQALFRVLEKNGFLHSESLTIEAFKAERNLVTKSVIDKALRMPQGSDTITGPVGIAQSTYPSSGFLSLTFWAKLDENHTTTDEKFIVEVDNSGNDNIFIIDIFEGSLRARIFKGCGTLCENIYKAPVSNVTEWNHYAIIINIDAAEEVPTLYINAVPATFTYDSGAQTGNLGTIAGRISLLGNDQPSSVGKLQGSLQHFAFYNKRLSPVEVNEVYISRSLEDISFASNIIDYWQLGNEDEFDEFNYGDSVTDGLTFQATIGSTSLTIDESIFISQGAHPTIQVNDEKLVPLNFSKKEELIVDDILVEEVEIERDDFGPLDVEYFFDLRVDKEIPLSDICEGVRQLKGNGITGDFEVECPDVGNNINVNIYNTAVTPQDIEDCEQ